MTILLGVLFATALGADIQQLSWIAGCWEGQSGPVRIEEQWSKPAGGTMLGMSRTLKGGKTIFSEFMRITQDGSKVVYMARIGTKAAPTPFELVHVSAAEAVFENPAHDFPKRIRYAKRADGSLAATISGAAGQRATTFVFIRRGPG